MKFVDFRLTPQSYAALDAANILPNSWRQLAKSHAFSGVVNRSIGFCDNSGVFSAPFLTADENLPQFDLTNREPFDDLIWRRAQEIVDEGKRINVFWSGGIDSTLVLEALLHVADQNQLTVYMNNASAAEYPAMAQDLERRVRVVHTQDAAFPRQQINPHHLYVTGEGGDRLVISIAHKPRHLTKLWAIAPDFLERPWRDYFLYHDLSLFEFGDRKLHALDYEFEAAWEEHAAACPFEIRTVGQMQWWRNLTFRMQFIKYRWLAGTTREEFLAGAQCARHFYMADYFYNWSAVEMMNAIGHPRSLIDWKRPFTEMIYTLRKDRHYRDTKTVMGSFQLPVAAPFYARTERGDEITSLADFTMLAAEE